MTGEKHLSGGLLQRFLLGNATERERELAVRHLLRGCEKCQRAARRAWFPDEDAIPKRSGRVEPKAGSLEENRVAEAHTEKLTATLASILHDLSRIRRQLQRLERALPESDARADIQCGIVDRLSPLIEGLRTLGRRAAPERRRR